jgi:hypothetical protein
MEVIRAVRMGAVLQSDIKQIMTVAVRDGLTLGRIRRTGRVAFPELSVEPRQAIE